MAMISIPHIASRVLNAPLAVSLEHGAVIASVLRQRLDIKELAFDVGDDGTVILDQPAMEALQGRARENAAARRGTRERIYDVVDTAAGDIAIIPVAGTLMKNGYGLDPVSGMTGYDGLTAKLHAAVNDDVAGVLWDIDSPGGEVAGLFDLVDTIKASNGKAGGPLMYASVNEEASSAAYAIASAADRVYMPRTGRAGSIGVIALHTDQSEAMAAEGVKVRILRSTGDDHKAEANSLEPLSDEAASRWQGDIDTMAKMFRDTVATNRGMTVKSIRELKGGVLMGSKAHEYGLVDGIKSAGETFMALQAAIKRRS